MASTQDFLERILDCFASRVIVHRTNYCPSVERDSDARLLVLNSQTDQNVAHGDVSLQFYFGHRQEKFKEWENSLFQSSCLKVTGMNTNLQAHIRGFWCITIESITEMIDLSHGDTPSNLLGFCEAVTTSWRFYVVIDEHRSPCEKKGIFLPRLTIRNLVIGVRYATPCW